MNIEHFNKFRDALTKAVKEHTEKGGTIISGKFREWDKLTCQCPITCLLGEKSKDSLMSKAIAEKLDIPFTADDMWSFIYAFDGREQEVWRGTINQELWVFGKELRAELIKDK
jgi:hypothetical protein